MMQTFRNRIFFIVFLFCCDARFAAAQQPLFQLLSPAETGVGFINGISENENLNILAYEYFYNGGGVAVGDINNDGLPDLFFTANMRPNKLYLNLGKLKFRDITATAGEGLEGRKGGWKTGVTMADVNGDGLLDIYVCYSGKTDSNNRRNELFINQGNNHFKESAAAYGLDDPGYSTQAAFFDYDNDGDLDMFLLNHNVKKIDNMELAKYIRETDPYAGSKLFENRNNHFVDVSVHAGIHQSPLTFGLGIAIADINQDGWPDIYVTNDYSAPDYMYINAHDGTFHEESQQRLRHLSQFSMGVDIADLNNDAKPDIITLDMLPEDNRRQKLLQLQENYESFQLMQDQDLYKQYMRNMLQLNNGDGSFSEIGQIAGISNTDWSWCPLIADFDNDGYKDIFVTTGYMRDYTNKDFLRYWGDYKVKKAMDREPAQMMDLVKAMPVTRLSCYAFANNHNLTFANKQKEWGLDKKGLANGAVYADLDNDGDLDLVINNLDAPAAIYRNTAAETGHGHYLAVTLQYKNPNGNGFGAKVYCYRSGQVQYEELTPCKGYLSSVSTVLHFGFGDSAPIDSLLVIWPDQRRTILGRTRVDQALDVKYAETTPASPPAAAGKTLFEPVRSPLQYQHEDFNDNDFKRQPLMLFMYSKTEPVMQKADLNRDGLEDLYISGDKSKPGRIYFQQKGGNFQPSSFTLGDEQTTATGAVAFFDANGDGYPDLYLAKGGYSQFEPHTFSLQDTLYLNDGTGNLAPAAIPLPDVSGSSKSCVRPADIDGDGDIDLFVGGHVIPGQYPVTPRSYLLINDGKGHFTTAVTPFDSLGMITDAAWTDIDGDGRPDLILCGEFMPVTIFMNTAAGFVDKTSTYFSRAAEGFWFSLAIADVNGDGHPDIIAGNLGLNTQIRADSAKPAMMYYGDFDKNGSIDPLFSFYCKDSSYPFVSRDELNDQMFSMRRRFTSYEKYAAAAITDILTPEQMKEAGRRTVTELHSTVFLFRDGRFVPSVLPLQAQFSPVSHILVKDYNKDGFPDLLLLGNHSDNRLKLGSFDANYGCLLQGDGKGNFTYIPQTKSGLSVTGDVKSAVDISVDHIPYLFIGRCNESLQAYREPQ